MINPNIISSSQFADLMAQISSILSIVRICYVLKNFSTNTHYYEFIQFLMLVAKPSNRSRYCIQNFLFDKHPNQCKQLNENSDWEGIIKTMKEDGLLREGMETQEVSCLPPCWLTARVDIVPKSDA